MYWNMALLFYTPIVVYIASFWGIEGIAYGYVLSSIVLFVPAWYYLLYKIIKVKFNSFIINIIVLKKNNNEKNNF